MTRASGAFAGGLTLLLLAACGPASAAGTVTLGGDSGEACVPVRIGQSMLVGEVMGAVTAQVEVSTIELSDAAGVRVVESYVLPVDGDAIGSSEFPPDDTPSWQRRRAAAGAQLDPGTSYNVVVRVERTDDAVIGSASALRVSYLSGHSQRSAEGTTRYRFAGECF